MRLIDANALRAEFTGNFNFEQWHYTGIRAMIDVQPTIDAVEVVHGRWEMVEFRSSPFGVDQEYQCSICGTPAEYEFLTRYCPNCGAKMDGERKNDDKRTDSTDPA